MNKPAIVRSRVLWALAAVLAVFAVSLAATAPRASAATTGPACNYDRAANACIRLDFVRPFVWNPTVGIDVYLPEQYARDIVACGADFKASMWGWDNGGSADDFIADMVVSPGWPVASSSGLSTEFFLLLIDGGRLDEDDGTDEVYARISYWDCHFDLIRSFRTGIISADFRR